MCPFSGALCGLGRPSRRYIIMYCHDDAFEQQRRSTDTLYTYIIFSIDLQRVGSTRFYFRYYYNFVNYKMVKKIKIEISTRPRVSSRSIITTGLRPVVSWRNLHERVIGIHTKQSPTKTFVFETQNYILDAQIG